MAYALQFVGRMKKIKTTTTKTLSTKTSAKKGGKVLTLEDLTNVSGGTCTFGNKTGCET